MSTTRTRTETTTATLNLEDLVQKPAQTSTKQTMNPTTQQTAFLGALASTDPTSRNILLKARAGCGKTTAILMGVDAYAAVFPRHDILVCAYNKSIADEVGCKLKAAGHTDWKKVQASTLHALGFGLLKFAFGLDRDSIDEKKVPNIVRSLADVDTRCEPARTSVYDTYYSQILSLVRFAKQAGVGFFSDMQIADSSVWYGLADHFDVNGFGDTTELDKVVAASQVVYRASLDQTDTIDFDDMILLPLIKSLRVKFTKDIIFLDEAQDLSRARQALARKFLSPITGRMVVVGDDMQAIYGFSGADAQALHNLSTELDAITLPLSVTWRCPSSVVTLAQSIVPDLEAPPTAPIGLIQHLSGLPSDLTPVQDVILCRNTAPLITLAYEIIRSGKPCKVEGRQIGEGLIVLANRWKVATTFALANKLDEYQDRETQKAMAKGNEQKAADIIDRVATLLEVIKAVNDRGEHSVSSVVDFIKNLFADGADHVITLATYHRSKGREWQRVILWEHASRCPSKAARQEWQKQQERNLAYVAYTRTKSVLVFAEKAE